MRHKLSSQEKNEPYVGGPYLRNCWYIAGLPEELSEAPLGRVFLGDPVVLFRGVDGKPAALEDRCCHRHLPLSLGNVVAGTLQCGYHGLRFDRTGACVEVPGQSRIPPGAHVQSYPVIEKHNCLWIWMGDSEKADQGLIPNIFWRDDPGWDAGGALWNVACGYNLLIDIQLDNTHAPFVHPDTIGSGAIIDNPPKIDRKEQSISAARWMMDVVPSPTFARAIGSEARVDRWLIWEFIPPSLCAFDIGCARAGTGAETGDRTQGVTLHTAHFMTPETETTCHYFWSVGRNYRIDEETVRDGMMSEFTKIFSEDVTIVEAQQRSLNRCVEWKPVDVKLDAPVLQARQILNKMIIEEENT